MVNYGCCKNAHHKLVHMGAVTKDGNVDTAGAGYPAGEGVRTAVQRMINEMEPGSANTNGKKNRHCGRLVSWQHSHFDDFLTEIVSADVDSLKLLFGIETLRNWKKHG